jgi:hypothetical protein
MRIGLKRKRAGGERVWVAAFGKHPAWDDHFDSPGLDTSRLTQLRATLYSEGIGGSIDSGVWEQLDEQERITDFAHTIVWRTMDGVIVARLDNSEDGKGRKRYPLVVCAHARGTPMAWTCGPLVERVTRLARTCAQVETREGVLGEVELARGELRAEAGLLEAGEDEAGALNAAGTLAQRLGEEALVRVLYQCRREMRGFLRGGMVGDRSTSRALDVSAKQCRAPAGGRTPAEACALWLGVMGRLMGETIPVMVIVPDSLEMADVLVGEPEAKQFYCLRAGLGALPLASQVPYEIDEANRAWAGSVIRGEPVG